MKDNELLELLELLELDFDENMVERLEKIKGSIKDFLLIESPFIDYLSMLDQIFENETRYLC